MGILDALFGGPGTAAEQIAPAEARRRQQAGALLVDVREPDEWRTGHAPDATLIPMGQVPARLAELPADREILLICRSGNRSGQVQRFLLARGYQRVANVAGGMGDWARAGLPLAR
jgi:rhodanese-related sulfurtransferase